MNEQTAIEAARKVWPEAEGFERAPDGWTFRCGAGYAAVADTGQVATDPQGTRSDARRFMPREPIIMPTSLCEKGCPEGECYHGEPFHADFNDPWDGA
ncbi:hypothetical protein GA0115240_105831 [Streptomyces sp. DvalAA-14]|uniref:hypothetical protein n=1 Tax=unclassified Streptomyces TaxID=2593676 RepID=UPI00081B8C01|nr:MULTISPECIES: hypothetical protein [unclassified Streptomyces]MYS19178.1 hypothetical protein [Streptomyces sp. SID4948]SCD38395.1 hypothetical protein GA0115240_105831 [Streptomyces sp. DvalAA-14]